MTTKLAVFGLLFICVVAPARKKQKIEPAMATRVNPAREVGERNQYSPVGMEKKKVAKALKLARKEAMAALVNEMEAELEKASEQVTLHIQFLDSCDKTVAVQVGMPSSAVDTLEKSKTNEPLQSASTSELADDNPDVWVSGNDQEEDEGIVDGGIVTKSMYNGVVKKKFDEKSTHKWETTEKRRVKFETGTPSVDNVHPVDMEQVFKEFGPEVTDVSNEKMRHAIWKSMTNGAVCKKKGITCHEVRVCSQGESLLVEVQMMIGPFQALHATFSHYGGTYDAVQLWKFMKGKTIKDAIDDKMFCPCN